MAQWENQLPFGLEPDISMLQVPCWLLSQFRGKIELTQSHSLHAPDWGWLLCWFTALMCIQGVALQETVGDQTVIKYYPVQNLPDAAPER